jgi:hypothetical protein
MFHQHSSRTLEVICGKAKLTRYDEIKTPHPHHKHNVPCSLIINNVNDGSPKVRRNNDYYPDE